MRKLKLQVQISLDGYIAGPNSEMDWLEWNWTEDINQYVQSITEPVDCILLGRNLAEGFIPTWESHLTNPEMAPFAKKMVETPKVVFTKTLEESKWANTVIAKGELAGEVNRLKNQEGKDIIVYGGGTFVSSLVEANLIDEYHLFFNPTAIGAGMKIFTGKTSLALEKSIPFSCGINVLFYTPKKS
ncbi:MAG: dihydrofolate reductase family protein [Bacteroidia bacterium]